MADEKPRKKRRDGWGKTVPARAKLQTLEDLDQRCKAAQRAKQMHSAILADLGGADQLSTLAQRQALHAALDAAILEDMHTRWLAGEKVVIAEMITVENAFNRTAAQLGTERHPRDITKAVIESIQAEAKQQGDTQ